MVSWYEVLHVPLTRRATDCREFARLNLLDWMQWAEMSASLQEDELTVVLSAHVLLLGIQLWTTAWLRRAERTCAEKGEAGIACPLYAVKHPIAAGFTDSPCFPFILKDTPALALQSPLALILTSFAHICPHQPLPCWTPRPWDSVWAPALSRLFDLPHTQPAM